jgi:hypothetical protein
METGFLFAASLSASNLVSRIGMARPPFYPAPNEKEAASSRSTAGYEARTFLAGSQNKIPSAAGGCKTKML